MKDHDKEEFTTLRNHRLKNCDGSIAIHIQRIQRKNKNKERKNEEEIVVLGHYGFLDRVYAIAVGNKISKTSPYLKIYSRNIFKDDFQIQSMKDFFRTTSVDIIGFNDLKEQGYYKCDLSWSMIQGDAEEIGESAEFLLNTGYSVSRFHYKNSSVLCTSSLSDTDLGTLCCERVFKDFWWRMSKDGIVSKVSARDVKIHIRKYFSGENEGEEEEEGENMEEEEENNPIRRNFYNFQVEKNYELLCEQYKQYKFPFYGFLLETRCENGKSTKDKKEVFAFPYDDEVKKERNRRRILGVNGFLINVLTCFIGGVGNNHYSGKKSYMLLMNHVNQKEGIFNSSK